MWYLNLHSEQQSVCCDNSLYSLPYPTAKCCGITSYSTYEHACIASKIVSSNYCGIIKYVPTSHLCCIKRVIAKKYKNTMCCRYYSYDPVKYVFCNGTLHLKKTNHMCCYRYYYNLRTQFCCKYRVGLKKSYRCCRVGASYRICKL